jgi:hypothetical protein
MTVQKGKIVVIRFVVPTPGERDERYEVIPLDDPGTVPDEKQTRGFENAGFVQALEAVVYREIDRFPGLADEIHRELIRTS